jgi:hypothetical protein
VMTRLCLLSIALYIIPIPVFAQISITEIFYNAEGGDTGYEWIEIENVGDSEIDLSGWSLFEGGVNHKLSALSKETLSPSEVGVIIQNEEKFKSLFPGVATLWRAVFSLSNTGESLSLRDKEKVDQVEVAYSSELGASGDGLSLHREGGSFSPGTPSPGGNLFEEVVSEVLEERGSQKAQVEEFVFPRIVTQITEISESLFVGAPVYFDAQARSEFGDFLENAVYVWSFGDGSISRGKSLAHTYYQPGEYVVYVDAGYEEDSSGTRRNIHIMEPEIELKEVSLGFIRFANHTKKDIDMGGWFIKSLENVFPIPTHTFLASMGEISFPVEVLGFSPDISVTLHYPSGKSVSFVETEVEVSVSVTITPPQQSSVVASVPYLIPEVIAQEEFVEEKEQVNLELEEIERENQGIPLAGMVLYLMLLIGAVTLVMLPANDNC